MQFSLPPLALPTLEWVYMPHSPSEQEKQLVLKQRAVGQVGKETWSTHTYQSNPWPHLRRALKHRYKLKFLSNAWLKTNEMFHKFVLKNIDRTVSGTFTHMDNASLPGGNILCIDHILRTKTKLKYEWYASSLLENKDNKALGDTYRLWERFPSRVLMEGHNGDVSKSKVIEAITEQLNCKLSEGVDLFTSDLGRETIEDAERVLGPATLGQIVLGMSITKKGGTMIMKQQYVGFSPFSKSYIRLLQGCADQVSLYKPVPSPMRNSEIYIIVEGYHGVSQKILTTLLSFVEKWRPVPICSLDQDSELDALMKQLATKQTARLTSLLKTVGTPSGLPDYLNPQLIPECREWLETYYILPCRTSLNC